MSVSKNPGWDMSLDRICETLQAKRAGIHRNPGCPLALLVEHDLHLLRETQLAPHIETKLVAGRFLKMQREKRIALGLHPDQKAIEIVIGVVGGLVCGVSCTNPNCKVYIVDHDILIITDDPKERACYEEALARLKQSDMVAVY